MADNDKSDVMPKVDFSKLKIAQKYAEILERENRERALKLKNLRSKNLIVGGILCASVLSIYSYSILAVKQETFLDDFEEPVREKI